MRKPLLATLLVLLSLTLPLTALAEPAQWKQEGWAKIDFARSKIKWNEILSGGPPKDGIPSIDKPVFKPATDIKDLAPNEPVIGLDSPVLLNWDSPIPVGGPLHGGHSIQAVRFRQPVMIST